MSLLDNKIYIEDLNKVINYQLDYKALMNKTILISGACGLIGSCLIDILIKLNKEMNLNVNIIAIGRNIDKAKKRFKEYWDNNNFEFILTDINSDIETNKKVDYVIHLASNTHPKAYSLYPIETILTNVVGTKNLLELATKSGCKRFVFASSCEIYGENVSEFESFYENDLGYIDCNSLRAGYPESKRCGEALCQAYIKEKNLDVVIPRLSRCIGPTMLESDSKASSQFIKNGLEMENIVLKSEGNQFYSYTYVTDAVLGILVVLINGKKGEAYNISDESCNIKLKDMAKYIADYCGTKVIYELPDEIEKAGFSKATKAILNSEKIKAIGWKCQNDIYISLSHTLEILKNSK